MSLSAGTRLGSYEILSPLGAGGMGEVYRAKDSKLGREVAIKVLPDAFSKDPERLARFDQEARLLAALNHPNIAAIHGLEESNGVRFLVLELVPGDTLAERIAQGSIPVDEALTLCRQIAEALEAAHERGIIHRDLKPANVKVTPDGKVKVLDFGLAKAFETDATSGGEDLSQSPTASFRGSGDGVILGTAAYMSPEQARGKPVDKRTDIWSFGCVLYEVLTGKQAFAGETASDTISAILKDEPDWNRLPQTVTAGIRRLLRRCLAKDQRERLHDIADARIEIDESMSASDTGHSPEERAAGVSRPRTWWVALGAAVAGFAVGLTVSLAPNEPVVTDSATPVHFGIDLPLVHGKMMVRNPVISPDGTTIIYNGYSGNDNQIYVRSLSELESRPIAGTEGGVLPFLSPDGRWVGFFAGGKIKKIPLRGGQPLVVCDASQSSPGATWGPDNSILFSTWNSGLKRVSADGGKVEILTTPDEADGEMGHWWPE
ncbi:MAG: protein kinase, partial [Acidobacteriota bacterium]